MRTLKKADQLQRQIARDRELAAEENDAAMGLEDAKNRFLERIDELAEHRTRQLLVEWNLTGPPGQGGTVAAAAPVPLLKGLIADAGTRLTRISTLANASNLASGFIDALANRYGVAEINQGGDMVASMLKSIDESLPASTARATRGKYLRAEPVAALTSRGRVAHAGSFVALEDQMCDFGPDGLSFGRSPDRLDALVWALTALMLEGHREPRVRVSEGLALRLRLCRTRRLLLRANLTPLVFELVDDMLGNGRLIAIGRLLHALLRVLDLTVS
ncbi:hypothetical protein FHX09_002525 [Rhizobium sp. BK538]|nr:hypothetical protein [Rhizobium sp. BK538]